MPIGYGYPSARHKVVLRSGVTAPTIPNLCARWGKIWQWAPAFLREGTVGQSAPSGLEIPNEWKYTSVPLKCLHDFNRWRREGSFPPRGPYTWPKVCRCQKNRRGWLGAKFGQEVFGVQKSFYFSPGIEPKFPGQPLSGLITT